MEDQKDILKDHSIQILECITTLKEQRNEIKSLILKQLEERRILAGEIERLSHKLRLVNKSMQQRIITKKRYDETIEEVEDFYENLIKSTGQFLDCVKNNVHVLEGVTDKRIGTESISQVNNKNQSFKNIHAITLLKPTRVNGSVESNPFNEFENLKEESKEISVTSFHDTTDELIPINISHDQDNQSEQSSILFEDNSQMYKQAANHEEIIRNILGEQKTSDGLKTSKQKRKELLDETDPEYVMIGESTETLVSK